MRPGFLILKIMPINHTNGSLLSMPLGMCSSVIERYELDVNIRSRIEILCSHLE